MRLLLVLSALVIILGLGVAIYFIVDDAIDKKIEGCMFKHFQAKELLAKYNVTALNDQSNSSFATDDCSSIIDEGRAKTEAKVSRTAMHPCMKNKIISDYLDDMMLKGVLEKFGHNGTYIQVNVIQQVSACMPTNIQQ